MLVGVEANQGTILALAVVYIPVLLVGSKFITLLIFMVLLVVSVKVCVAVVVIVAVGEDLGSVLVVVLLTVEVRVDLGDMLELLLATFGLVVVFVITFVFTVAI